MKLKETEAKQTAEAIYANLSIPQKMFIFESPVRYETVRAMVIGIPDEVAKLVIEKCVYFGQKETA